jgi:deazaflavin-dependent oxidoreductase (nitroreductase family)
MTVVRVLSVSLAILLSAVFAALVGFVVGVRNRNSYVLRFARAIQRDVVNRGTLRDAGTTGSPRAVVRARGRISGKTYDTPVGVQRAGDELYISLPYGERAQWVRNVRAAGGATVLHDGYEIEATTPELVPIAQTPIASGDRFAIAIFGITHALRLHVASLAPAPAPAPAR